MTESVIAAGEGNFADAAFSSSATSYSSSSTNNFSSGVTDASVSPSAAVNATLIGAGSDDRGDYLDRVLPSVIALIILFALSAVGNVTVFLTLVTSRSRKTRISIIILHLTIADLLVTFILIPTEVVWRLHGYWEAGNVACKVFAFLRAFGFYLASMVLMVVSVDRYIAIIYPLRANSAFAQRGHFMLMAAWAGAALCSAPQTIIWHTQPAPGTPDLEQCVTFGSDARLVTAFTMFFLVTVYFIPLIVMVVTYSRILATIIRQTQFRDQNSDDGVAMNGGSAHCTSSSRPASRRAGCGESSGSPPAASATTRANVSRLESIPLIEISTAANAATTPSGGLNCTATATAIVETPGSESGQPVAPASSSIVIRSNGGTKTTTTTSSSASATETCIVRGGSENYRQRGQRRQGGQRLLSLNEGMAMSSLTATIGAARRRSRILSSTSSCPTPSRAGGSSAASETGAATEDFRSSHFNRARTRTLRMTVIIVLAFILCWTPNVVMSLWFIFAPESAMHHMDPRLADVLFILSLTNSVLNPYVYGSYASEMRSMRFRLRRRQRDCISRISRLGVTGEEGVDHSCALANGGSSGRMASTPSPMPQTAATATTTTATATTTNIGGWRRCRVTMSLSLSEGPPSTTTTATSASKDAQSTHQSRRKASAADGGGNSQRSKECAAAAAAKGKATAKRGGEVEFDGVIKITSVGGKRKGEEEADADER